MSVQSEISRLQTAKADIRAAIEAKGVTVPADIPLDGYAEKISEIQGEPSDNIFQAIKFDVKSSDLENIHTYETMDGMDTIETADYTIPFPVTVNNTIFGNYLELSEQFGNSNLFFTANFSGMPIYIRKNAINLKHQINVLAWNAFLPDFELYMLIKVK